MNLSHYLEARQLRLSQHRPLDNLFLARLPRISVNWNEKYRPYSFQTLAIFPEISGNFPEILNFRKIYNPTRSRAKNKLFFSELNAES